MPKLQKVAGKVQLEVERFDGGRNTKDAPSELSIYETPDDLNVTYDDQGSCATRDGTTTLNTQTVGSSICDGQASYNGSMVAWFGGDMFYLSGTTFVTVPSAQSQFVSGVKIAYAKYQDILFCSDGTSAYRYEGGSSFYQHGIQVPSNCRGSGTSAGVINSGTYYYTVAYENSHVVEGEAGAYVTVSNPNTACVIGLTSIPTGDASHGVANRQIYRASNTAGPWRWVGELADNTTSSFADVMSATTWQAGRTQIDDGTAPTPYTAVKVHKERLFFTDTNRDFIRWTNWGNPFVSESENYYPLGKGTDSDIRAIGVQDDLVSAFKDDAIWVGLINEPTDDTTWQWVKSPANLGIAGLAAFWEGPGYIFFLARSAAGVSTGKLYGFCILQGLDVQDASVGPLRTRSISEKIEPDVLGFNPDFWDDVSMVGYNNAVHIACATASDGSENNHIYWFDINRLTGGDPGQPGSWALWDGLNIRTWCVHNGVLYGGCSDAVGKVYAFYRSIFSDSGAAIDSYFYTKPLGGEPSIDSWIKDWRWLNVWFEQVGNGNWSIYAKSEKVYDGAGGSTGGDEVLVDNVTSSEVAAVYGAAPGGGVGIFGTSSFFVPASAIEGQWSLSNLLARRVQFKFSNENTAGQAFKVLGIKALMNLRRQR